MLVGIDLSLRWLAGPATETRLGAALHQLGWNREQAHRNGRRQYRRSA